MGEPISRAQLLDSTPVSDAEFAAAWDALLAFEANDGAACRPSAATIVKTISEINTSATAESFSLSSPSGFTVSAILGMLDDVEIPAGLVMAVIRGMCDRVTESMDDNAWRLNTDKCCMFVGETLLQDCMDKINSQGTGARRLNTATPTTRSAFMAKWKATVPEECASKCRLDTIKVCTVPCPSSSSQRLKLLLGLASTPSRIYRPFRIIRGRRTSYRTIHSVVIIISACEKHRPRKEQMARNIREEAMSIHLSYVEPPRGM